MPIIPRPKFSFFGQSLTSKENSEEFRNFYRNVASVYPNIGTEDEFYSKLQDPKLRQNFFTNTSIEQNPNTGKLKLGNEKEFSNKLDSIMVQNEKFIYPQSSLDIIALSPNRFRDPNFTTSSKLGFKDFVGEIVKTPEKYIPFARYAGTLRDINEIADVSRKLFQGEEVSDDDVRMLYNYQQYNSTKKGWGYIAPDVVAGSIAFAGEMALSSGIYSKVAGVARESLVNGLAKLMSKEGKDIVKNRILNLAVRSAGSLAGSVARTPVISIPTIIAQTTRRTMPKVYLEQDDDGQIVVASTEQGEDFWSALPKELTDAYIQVASESAGEFFKLDNFISPAAKNKLAETTVFRLVKKLNPRLSDAKAASVIRNKFLWNGFGGEWAEERVADVWTKMASWIGLADKQEFVFPTLHDKDAFVGEMVGLLGGSAVFKSAEVFAGAVNNFSTKKRKNITLDDYLSSKGLSVDGLTTDEKSKLYSDDVKEYNNNVKAGSIDYVSISTPEEYVSATISGKTVTGVTRDVNNKPVDDNLNAFILSNSRVSNPVQKVINTFREYGANVVTKLNKDERELLNNQIGIYLHTIGVDVPNSLLNTLTRNMFAGKMVIEPPAKTGKSLDTKITVKDKELKNILEKGIKSTISSDALSNEEVELQMEDIASHIHIDETMDSEEFIDNYEQSQEDIIQNAISDIEDFEPSQEVLDEITAESGITKEQIASIVNSEKIELPEIATTNGNVSSKLVGILSKTNTEFNEISNTTSPAVTFDKNGKITLNAYKVEQNFNSGNISTLPELSNLKFDNISDYSLFLVAFSANRYANNKKVGGSNLDNVSIAKMALKDIGLEKLSSSLKNTPSDFNQVESKSEVKGKVSVPEKTSKIEDSGIHNMPNEEQVGKTSVFEQEIIKREDLIKNRNVQYLFGDNLEQKGLGGQAKEMRGEPNAFGIPTKKKPTSDFDAYFTDDEFEQNKEAIDNAFSKLDANKPIVIPKAGLGTGLAMLDKKAPKTFSYLQFIINQLLKGSQKPTSTKPTTTKTSSTKESEKVTSNEPDAVFIGIQRGLNREVPLYNVVQKGHPLYGSTVSEETLKKSGLKVPERTPSEPIKGSPISTESTQTQTSDQPKPNFSDIISKIDKTNIDKGTSPVGDVFDKKYRVAKSETELSESDFLPILKFLKSKYGINYAFVNDQNLKWSGSFQEIGNKLYTIINLAKADKLDSWHEYAHPFVHAFNKSNPTQFNSIYDSIINLNEYAGIYDNIKKIRDDLVEGTELFKEEVVTEVVGIGAAENAPSKIRMIVSRFINWLKGLLSRITGKKESEFDFSKIRTIDDLINSMLSGKQINVKKMLSNFYNKQYYSMSEQEESKITDDELDNQYDFDENDADWASNETGQYKLVGKILSDAIKSVSPEFSFISKSEFVNILLNGKDSVDFESFVKFITNGEWIEDKSIVDKFIASVNEKRKSKPLSIKMYNELRYLYNFSKSTMPAELRADISILDGKTIKTETVNPATGKKEPSNVRVSMQDRLEHNSDRRTAYVDLKGHVFSTANTYINGKNVKKIVDGSVKVSDYFLLTLENNLSKIVNSSGNPTPASIVGLKSGNKERLIITTVTNNDIEIATDAEKSMKYFEGEIASGNITQDHINTIIEFVKKQSKSGNSLALAQAIARHEWWKSTRHSKYLFDASSKGVYDDLNRTQLDLAEGNYLRGLGSWSAVVYKAESLNILTESGKTIPLNKDFLNVGKARSRWDGTMLASGDFLYKIAYLSGNIPIYGGANIFTTKPVAKYRTVNGNNYISMKMEFQQPDDGIQLIDNSGKVVIFSKKEQLESPYFKGVKLNVINLYKREYDDNGNHTGDVKIDTFGTDNEVKRRYGDKLNSDGSVLLLPEESLLIIKENSELGKKSAPHPFGWIDKLLSNEFQQNNIFKENFDKYIDWIISNSDNKMKEFFELRTNPSKYIKRLEDNGILGRDGSSIVELLNNLSGDGKYAAYNPSISAIYTSNFMNTYIIQGIYKGRRENNSTSLSIRLDEQDELKSGEGNLSGTNRVIIQAVLEKLYGASDAVVKMEKYLDANDIEKENIIQSINDDLDKHSPIYFLASRNPVPSAYTVGTYRLKHLKFNIGETVELNSIDVFGKINGDADSDTMAIEFVPIDIATALNNMQNTDVFKSRYDSGRLEIFKHPDMSGSLVDMDKIYKLSSKINSVKNMQGIFTNAGNLRVLLENKNFSMKMKNGNTITVIPENEMVVMSYAPLDIELLKNKEVYSSINTKESNGSVVDKSGNEIPFEKIGDAKEAFLKTTSYHEFTILTQAAVDNHKELLLPEWGFKTGYNMVITRMFKIVDSSGNIKEINANPLNVSPELYAIKSVLNYFKYSPYRQGNDKYGNKAGINELTNKSKQVSLYIDQENKGKYVLNQLQLEKLKQYKHSIHNVESINLNDNIAPVEKLLSTYKRVYDELKIKDDGVQYSDPFALPTMQLNNIHSLVMQEWSEILKKKQKFSMDDYRASAKFILDAANKFYGDIFGNNLYITKDGRKIQTFKSETNEVRQVASQYNEAISAFIEDYLPKFRELTPQQRYLSTFMFFDGILRTNNISVGNIIKNVQVQIPLELQSKQASIDYHNLWGQKFNIAKSMNTNINRQKTKYEDIIQDYRNRSKC